MGIFEDFLYKVKSDKGLKFDSEVADLIGIDRRSLASAKTRGILPIKYIKWYCDLFNIDRTKFEGHLKGSGKQKSKGNNEEMDYIIEAQKETISLQKEKINRLEERILKHKETPIQSTVWDSLEFDYSVKLSITFKNFKMGRTILEVGNKERISEVLGYSIQEIDDFWDIGVLYTNFKAHPVDAILSKETKKEIDKQILSLPNIFEALKDMMGSHYIPQPITYICKDKSQIHSISYNKVDWKNKIVESKIQFLLDE